jgi:dipeptidyl-peptidase 4
MDVDGFPRQLARTQRFSLGVPRAFTLSADGDRLLFLRTRGPEDRTGCLWLLADGREHLLVDPEPLLGADEVPEAELVRRERTRERSVGLVAYSADTALSTAVFCVDGRLWAVRTDGGDPWPVPTAGPAVDPQLDPTGTRVAYVTGGALHVTDVAAPASAPGSSDEHEGAGRDRQLAAPEHPQVTWGLAEHVAAESMGRTRGHWWAPDGTALLAARVDVTKVQRWWITDPADPARPPREIAYPAAGTTNADVSLHILGVDDTRVEVLWDRIAYEYMVTAAWDAHGPMVTVQSRDQRTLRVLAVDPGTGKTTLVHEQRDPAWVQLIPGTPQRTGSGLLVHTDDAETTRHLTVGGAAVTPQGLQIREVLDTDGESVLFIASEEPTEEHLWAYDPEGGLTRLSDGPGVHAGHRAGGALLLASYTEDGNVFRIVRTGRPDTPVRTLGARPLVVPQATWLRAGDLEIRTILFLPSWYRPGQRLPVLMCPYGGPAGQLVLRVWHASLCEAQWFAESGFAVVIADGRGTPGRGPAWEKAVHGDSLTAPVEDQVTALHAAGAHCPDLDLSRVGIRGWSYGGTLAAAAVLRRPDVFHAAVSGAAPSDQRLYDTHWRERFLGHPDQEPENYERSSTLRDAATLSRPLLLVHGLADDNVVAAHTLRMSAALLAAGRPHQVLPLSATHMPTAESAAEGVLHHQLDFLRQALGVPARVPPPAADAE